MSEPCDLDAIRKFARYGIHGDGRDRVLALCDELEATRGEVARTPLVRALSEQLDECHAEIAWLQDKLDVLEHDTSQFCPLCEGYARERDEARAERDGAREAVDDLNRQMKCVTHTWPDCGGTCDFPCKPRVADTHPQAEGTQ